MTKFFDTAHRIHTSTVHAFEGYGHIFFFIPMVVDHTESPYGLACAVVVVFYTVCAACNRKLEA